MMGTFTAKKAYYTGGARKASCAVRFLLASLLVAAWPGVAGCGAGPPAQFSFTGEALGSFYTVTVVAPPAGFDEEQARQITRDALDTVNELMSTYREDSELSRFNRHDDATPFRVSAPTHEVFRMAQEIAVQSNGAFDVTVGPLVNAWGFGPEAFQQAPDEVTLAMLRERVGYEKITVHGDGAVSKKHPEVYCDLSGIAKGYATDAVAIALEEAGVTRYMVEVGGEIRVAGANADGNPWRLGIEKPLPDTRQLHTVVHLTEGALATSGDYRNMYELDGRRFSHTIDPNTGRPVKHNLVSASVIHESCAMADGYATALMALGPEKGVSFAEQQNLAVMLIIADEDNGFETIVTAQFQAYLQ